MRKSFARRLAWLLGLPFFSISLTLAAFFIFTPNPCRLKENNPASSSFMKLRKSEAQRQGKKFILRHQWISLREIPPILIEAVLSSEDDRFFNHKGFDWQELRRAFFDKKKDKTMRGASTISQQLIKNLYLSPERSLIRKFNEFILTIKLEQCLSKKRILECYLNIIELGNGIFGVQAASRHFFSKNVTDLTPGEMLRLVSVIPKPLRASPRSESQYTRWRVKWLADRLQRKGAISPVEYAAIAENSK